MDTKTNTVKAYTVKRMDTKIHIENMHNKQHRQKQPSENIKKEWTKTCTFKTHKVNNIGKDKCSENTH